MARGTHDETDAPISERSVYFEPDDPGSRYNDNMPRRAVGRLVEDYITDENEEAERIRRRSRMAELSRRRAQLEAASEELKVEIKEGSYEGSYAGSYAGSYEEPYEGSYVEPREEPKEEPESVRDLRDVDEAGESLTRYQSKRLDVSEVIRNAGTGDAVYDADYLEYIHSSDTVRLKRGRYRDEPERVSRTTQRHREFQREISEKQQTDVDNYTEPLGVNSEAKGLRTRAEDRRRKPTTEADSKAKKTTAAAAGRREEPQGRARFGVNTIVALAAVILLIILCFFIMTIQRLNDDLDERDKTIATLVADRDEAVSRANEANRLSTEIAELTTKNNDLIEENNRLKEMLGLSIEDSTTPVPTDATGATGAASNELPSLDPATATHKSTPTPGFRYILNDIDTLTSISRAAYGTVNYSKIFEANKDVISNPNVVSSGMDIYIPIIVNTP